MKMLEPNFCIGQIVVFDRSKQEKDYKHEGEAIGRISEINVIYSKTGNQIRYYFEVHDDYCLEEFIKRKLEG